MTGPVARVATCYKRSREMGTAARFAHLPLAAARDAVTSRLPAPAVPGDGVWSEAVEAGVGWLCRSHDATGRRGSSYSFSLVHGWRPAFPETTGYVIGTLLACRERVGGAAELERRAREMGDWEIELQDRSGGIMEGLLADPPRPPLIFNTGMVIHGWLDLYEALGEERYVEAAARGGAFMVREQKPDGSWSGEHTYHGLPKTYKSRAAWALLRLAAITGEGSFRAAARRHLDWVVSMQSEDGWFDHCVFVPGTLPNTHGLAYTLRGLLESHALLDHERYLEAAIRTSEVLIRKLEVLGRLPGVFRRGWIPAARWEIVTGTAQLGGVWLRLYELTGDARYLNAGLKAVEQAAAHQVRLDWAPVRGAVPGSYPIYGRYAPLQYPNWATKFLVDSLIRRESCLRRLERPAAV